MMGFISRLLTDGGPVIIVLAALSVLSIAVMVVKAIQFMGTGGGKRVVTALDQLQQGQDDAAAATLDGGKGPAGRVVAYGVAGLKSGLSVAALDAEMTRRGNGEVEALNRWLRVLELVALIAPLLGLLGTVLGMIQSFQELEMAEGSANASVLAGGIWQALLTTAVGLVVAIPAAIGASLFSAGAERAAHSIESSAGRLLLIARARGG
ncbi:MotA/TolQ/ExbB proton channel family protein [Abyssibius alkaniclasticus]|uniref:MotA/TolQ/ExbB proton channel family protein n=1 Tax=Abyssibius alkaniclasticus TaxID=2881234 RepID=UPI0023640C8D|nr:MotA/TolQ/ExbB proton channel family protein [Abyssibius alkaniclasticus]UPH71677.1 MotA/TolQ/ExbB proton channel family protein [Abyssibius alkaniclasticus]|tara:strand:+ start:1756 stop:2379 length:624 start_codon:yes stop_codon:yes gene_type:complete